CCGFWRWPRREAQRRYPQRSRPSEQRRPAPKSTQPSTARGRRAAGPESIRLTASLGRCSPLLGCAPLAPSFCLYARPTPVFQQSPNDLIRYLASPFAARLFPARFVEKRRRFLQKERNVLDVLHSIWVWMI